MRRVITLLAAAIVTSGAAGCSSGASSLPTPISNASVRSFAELKKIAGPGFSVLAVTDPELTTEFLFNGSYEQIGDVTNGVNGPDGNWIDSSGNQYLAQFGLRNVVEYTKKTAKNNGAPNYTYTSGLTNPVGVTTDTSQHIFVADGGGGYTTGSIVEYRQHSNKPITTCGTGLFNAGIVVAPDGSVFVSGDNPRYGPGYLIEFKGGLKGCKAKTLAVSLKSTGGLQMDNSGDLVACDEITGVDIIPPPYKAIRSTITGTVTALNDALTQDNKLIFIADPHSSDVAVDDYPGGKRVMTVSAPLSAPYGVATFPYQKKLKGQ
jgi:hypothetical protein